MKESEKFTRMVALLNELKPDPTVLTLFIVILAVQIKEKLPTAHIMEAEGMFKDLDKWLKSF